MLVSLIPREILLRLTPLEAPTVLQASMCSELRDPMSASCKIFAQLIVFSGCSPCQFHLHMDMGSSMHDGVDRKKTRFSLRTSINHDLRLYIGQNPFFPARLNVRSTSRMISIRICKTYRCMAICKNNEGHKGQILPLRSTSWISIPNSRLR